MNYIFLFIPIFLIGCQSVHQPNPPQPAPTSKPIKENKKDGPPAMISKVASIDVKPEILPLSRYGNPAEYRVDGQSYEVMTSAKDYSAEGLASWYGTKFHTKLTSSGEVYDLNAMTAAHKTLPLPTYVSVTNLNNGKKIIVKVNDRGPFHKDRLIDLSYGAARKLGFVEAGTAPVKVEVVHIKDQVVASARYYLQVGAFSKENYARELSTRLKKLTSTPIFIEKKHDYFLVKAGPLASKSLSDKLKDAFKKQGFERVISLLQ